MISAVRGIKNELSESLFNRGGAVSATVIQVTSDYEF